MLFANAQFDRMRADRAVEHMQGPERAIEEVSRRGKQDNAEDIPTDKYSIFTSPACGRILQDKSFPLNILYDFGEVILVIRPSLAGSTPLEVVFGITIMRICFFPQTPSRLLMEPISEIGRRRHRGDENQVASRRSFKTTSTPMLNSSLRCLQKPHKRSCPSRLAFPFLF